MKQLKLKDIVISVSVSIFLVIVFFLFILLTLLISAFFVGFIIMVIFNLFTAPFTGKIMSFSEFFGANFGSGMIKFILVMPLSLFVMWQFYVAVITISILDLAIRRLNLIRITKSSYANGLIVYLVLGIVIGYLLEMINFNNTGSNFAMPSLVTVFFIIHYHLALSLQYVMNKFQSGKFTGKFFGKLASKLKRHSVTENDSEF